MLALPRTEGERYMSDVNANDQRLVNEADEIFGLYLGSGKDAKAGIEVELSFFDPKKADLPVMSLSQNRVLKNSTQGMIEGDWLHNEPTSEVLEISSIPAPFADIRRVLDDAAHKMHVLKGKAQSLGLKRSYFQELPDKISEDLLSRIVDVNRYKVMYAPYRDDMKDCVRYFSVCKSTQVSVSYTTQDHALENVRRLYLLAPFLFLLADNSTGFSEGKPLKGHAGMSLRHQGLLEGRGGVFPYALTARTGEEFFRSHIEHVMNNPLFMYYDLAGNLVRVPSGEWITFNQLKDKGLNTASNYFLAQSLLWPDVKIAALKDEQGAVSGHRYEARMFGVGVHQYQMALLVTSGLAFHKDFAANTDDLLERYGFHAHDPRENYSLLQKSYETAREHNGKFFDVPYGIGKMSEFAVEFAEIAESMADDIGMEEEIQPLLDICRTGCTDGKVNRFLFPTLEDVLQFQKTSDPEIFDNPNFSARMLFQKEIGRKKGSSDSRPCCR